MMLGLAWKPYLGTTVYRSISKHGVLTNPGLCMALPSFSFRSFSTLSFFLVLVGTYLQHPPGLSTQDFAPPKPLIDLLVEKSPALTVKLWSKVQLGREV